MLVVDDGSSDDTARLAREHGARVIAMDRNSGPATARTRGAENAACDVIVFTDTDVWLPADALEKIRAAFRDPGIHAVQGVFSAECPHSDFYSQYKNLYNRFVLLNLPDRIDTTYTSLTAVRKEAFFKSGGFDLNIRSASVEDRTLGIHLVNAGYDIHLRRDIEVIHNKAITFRGFLRNQFRRSRDLIKLGLRSRGQRKKAEKGRYGTNSRRAMLRIPAAYAFLALVGAAAAKTFFQPDTADNLPLWLLDFAYLSSAALATAVVYIALAADFLFYLRRQKGIGFAIRAIDANFMDAVVCGMGIVTGAVEFLLLKRRY